MINITGGAIKKNTKEKTSVKTEYENIEVERESAKMRKQYIESTPIKIRVAL